MKRFMELGSALAATTIGLIGVLTEVRALVYPFDNAQLGGVPAGFGLHNWSVMSSQANHFMVLLALLLVGLSIGAYLHAIYQSTMGLALLWICTVSLIVAVSFVTLTPPAFDFNGGSVNAVVLDVVPTSLSVLTVVLAAVSAVAAITPLRWGALGESATWLRKLDRITRPHLPV